jgi:hypothetical protein
MPIRFLKVEAMERTEKVRPTLQLADRDLAFAGTLVLLALCFFKSVLGRPGGFSEEPEPDPISNSAVKLLSADGT